MKSSYQRLRDERDSLLELCKGQVETIGAAIEACDCKGVAQAVIDSIHERNADHCGCPKHLAASCKRLGIEPPKPGTSGIIPHDWS